ncbi:MAG: hypothetical protein J5J00_17540 [Deltaproteobacteria bacterium]|nr:hypothetical protein [Deltaproteobacteria bacterium]
MPQPSHNPGKKPTLDTQFSIKDGLVTIEIGKDSSPRQYKAVVPESAAAKLLTMLNPASTHGGILAGKMERRIFNELARVGRFQTLRGQLIDRVVSPILLAEEATVDIKAKGAIFTLEGENAKEIKIKAENSTIRIDIPSKRGGAHRQAVHLNLAADCECAGTLEGSEISADTQIHGWALGMNFKGTEWQDAQTALTRLKNMVFSWDNVESDKFKSFSGIDLSPERLNELRKSLNGRRTQEVTKKISGQLRSPQVSINDSSVELFGPLKDIAGVEAKDTACILLPIGTDKAYAYQLPQSPTAPIVRLEVTLASGKVAPAPGATERLFITHADYLLDLMHLHAAVFEIERQIQQASTTASGHPNLGSSAISDKAEREKLLSEALSKRLASGAQVKWEEEFSKDTSKPKPEELGNAAIISGEPPASSTT